MPYILSTLSSNQNYTQYVKGINGVNNKAESVFIKGGANVADKTTLTTPKGVSTEITKDQLEILKANKDFKRHLENGFLTILDDEPKTEKIKEKAQKMRKDASKQKTAKDFKKAPKTKKEKNAEEE